MSSPTRQRGMVTVLVMLFLIATVVFALSQMLGVSGNNVIDGQRQGDSGAAFFLAESGLEKGQAAYKAALVDAASNTSCTGIATAYNLGRGTVAVTGTSTPATCTGLACLDCSVRSVGTVGISTRTVTRQVDLNTQQGTFCNGPVTHNCSNNPAPPTWKLNLSNTSGYAGVGMFNLAYVGKGSNTATCAGASNCQLQFDLGSPSAGQNSAGIMGNSVNIPASTSYQIYQIMDNADRSLVEVGVIFKGSSAAPILTGTGGAGGASFWNTSSSGNGTTGSTDVTGRTNDGTFTSTGSCAATSANNQTCTHWCYGGDTLVFSYAAKVGSVADGLTSVSFGTGAGGTQSVPLVPVAKYPVTTAAGAPADVEAEIWYARNPNLVGASPLALNASSYKGRGTGAFGATWNGSNSETTKVNNGAGGAVAGNVLTVGSGFLTYPTQMIKPGAVGVGDVFSSSGGGAASNVNCSAGCPTILSQQTSAEAGGALGGRGTYTLSGAAQSVSSANNRVWIVSSTILNVSGCTICFFQNGDSLNASFSGRSITGQETLGTVATRGRDEATAAIGRYTTSPAGTPLQAGPGAAVRAGTPGTTLYLPFDSSLPAVTTPTMRIAIKTGTGVLATNTTVSSVSAANVPNAKTRSFTVSAAPTTALDDVSLCAGTCAFFLPGANTTFTIAKSAGTQEWTSGFTCLKGVDMPAQVVTRSTGVIKRWAEIIN